jgi:hypothetical protein
VNSRTGKKQPVHELETISERSTKDPVKGPENIEHLVRLQGFAHVSYNLRSPDGWQGSRPFKARSLYL